MIVLNRSWPAVSHCSTNAQVGCDKHVAEGYGRAIRRTIWSLIRFPSSSIVRILKSIPMVVMKEGVHASSQNRSSKHDLPTPVKCYVFVSATIYIHKYYGAHQSRR